MKRMVAVLGVVAIAALAAWLVGKARVSPDAEPRREDAPPPATAPSVLSPAPGMARDDRSPAASTKAPGPEGTFACEIHVTTLGTPARDVEIRNVDGPASEPLGPGVVRVLARPGSQTGATLSGAAIPMVRVDVPDPVPSRIDVRVPAESDPRLENVVLLVVDEKTGKPLPDALLDPGAKAP